MVCAGVLWRRGDGGVCAGVLWRRGDGVCRYVVEER